MMKKSFIIIFFIIFKFCYSQDKSGKVLAEKLSGKTFTIEGIVNYANKNISDDYEKAKFFYYWIGSNIKYDHELIEKMSSPNYNYDLDYSYNLSPKLIFEKKKAVCYGYSVLFKYFMDKVDISCLIVSGHIRDERNHYLNLNKDSDFSHAWNVIEINEKWKIVDSTWGNSGEIEVSDYYFDILPERAILTHFPENPKWQLLENPLTLEEFNKSIYINAIWFKIGFDQIPKVLKDDEYYYFTYKTNSDKLDVNIEISYDNIKFESLTKITKIQQDDINYLRFEKKIVTKLLYVKVNITKIEDEGFTIEYKDVINFKLL